MITLQKDMFLVNSEAMEELLCEDVNLLVKYYRDDVDINLVREIKCFHAYITRNDSDEGHLCHSNLYQVIFQGKIQLAFPNVTVIL
jgi:hypothetical protein